MKSNFLTRTLTAILFVVIIFVALFLHHILFGIVFYLFMVVALQEFYNIPKQGNIPAQKKFGILTGSIIFIISYLHAHELIGIYVFLLLVPLFMSFFLIEIFKTSENHYNSIATTIFGIIYITVPFSMFNYLGKVEIPGADITDLLLPAFFVILWSNDTGAYITGSLAGRHKFAENISPKKTIEGTFGGIVLATVVAALMSLFDTGLSVTGWIGLGLIISISGTYGDLAESMLKRRGAIKDSGTILPGHGGILDRFDSFLFAVPAAYTYIQILQLNIQL
ncbi:MAG: phosphatidate cytidylyltransferase [Bacteroidota bacterium]|nr:phosphatidate cytidylyltransferase [Bacteroidota bacterium]